MLFHTKCISLQNHILGNSNIQRPARIIDEDGYSRTLEMGLRRVLIVSPLLILSVLLMLIFLINSIAGLPPAITDPMCPNEITESGYVDFVEFTQTDCVAAVKSSAEQTVPYFKGLDIAFVAFFLVLTLFLVKILNGGSENISQSPRMAAMLDSSIWDEPDDYSAGLAHQTLQSTSVVSVDTAQQVQQPLQQQNETGFHNPFDF